MPPSAATDGASWSLSLTGAKVPPARNPSHVLATSPTTSPMLGRGGAI